MNEKQAKLLFYALRLLIWVMIRRGAHCHDGCFQSDESERLAEAEKKFIEALVPEKLLGVA